MKNIQKSFKISFKNGFINFSKIGIFSAISLTKYKKLEFNIFYGGNDFCIKLEGPIKAVHSICFSEFQLPKLFDIQLEFYDSREREAQELKEKKSLLDIKYSTF